MKLSLTLLALLFVGLALWKCQERIPPPKPDNRGESAVEVAKSVIHFLPDVIDTVNMKQMGLNSLEELKKLTTGTPMTRIYLRCDSVAAYTASKGEDVTGMIISNIQIVPLLVDGRPRLTVISDSIPDLTRKSAKPWTFREVGNVYLAQLLDTLLPKISERAGVPKTKFSLLVIPAIYKSYLSYATQEGTFLTMVPGGPSGLSCWPSKDETTPLRLSVVLDSLARCTELIKTCTEPNAPEDPLLRTNRDSLNRRSFFKGK